MFEKSRQSWLSELVSYKLVILSNLMQNMNNLLWIFFYHISTLGMFKNNLLYCVSR